MNIVIVEDEISVALRLKKFIEEILQDKIDKIEHFLVLDDGEEYLAENNIDLLFLDLNLNGQDGFDLLKNSLASSYQTIVVSANTDKAIDAFEFGVLDFIAKPFTRQRIEKAINRLNNSEPMTGKACRYLSVKTSGQIELIDIKDIVTIRADGNYAQIKLINNRTLLHDKTLEKLLLILPNNFQRVHKSYIAHIDKIKRLLKHVGSRYQLELTNGEVIPLGRTHYHKIKERLER